MVDYCRNVVLQVFQRPSFSGQKRKSYVCRPADGECDVIDTILVYFCVIPPPVIVCFSCSVTRLKTLYMKLAEHN